MATPLVIGIDDPRRDDVREVLANHLAFARGVTPAAFSFALEVDDLVDVAVTFFSARADGRVVGIAALKRLDDTHAELKSMHTIEAMRGRGVARALVEHILAFSRANGYTRVSLETGTTNEFLPARTLYARAGFRPCGPFSSYRDSPHNTFMSISLDPA